MEEIELVYGATRPPAQGRTLLFYPYFYFNCIYDQINAALVSIISVYLSMNVISGMIR